MTKLRKWVLAAAAGGIWAGSAAAQAPAPPAPAAAAAAAEKKGFFKRLCEEMDRKRRKLCTMPAGQMLNSMTKPLSTATGGIIPPFCPAMPSKEDLAKPGVEGDAARAKKDALEANARRQAVRLLGTYDCHWHPEAQDALIAALRTDRFECVRLEAAIALVRACCCTGPVIEALMDSVHCGEKFGPSENSPRVQQVALLALERCLSCYVETGVVEEKKGGDAKEGEEAPKPRKLEDPNAPAAAKPMSADNPSDKEKKPAYASRKPSRELIEQAKIVVAQAKPRLASVAAQPQHLPSGQRGLFQIVSYAWNGETESAPVQVASVEPAAPAPAVAVRPHVPSKPVAAEPAAMPPVAAKSVAKETAPAAKPATMEPAKPAPTTPTSIQRVKPAASVETPRTRPIDPTVLKCLETLRDAQDPEVRHTAVRTLAAFNWQDHPEAVLGLLFSARQDQHAGMRVACIRNLVKMKANTPEVVTGLRSLCNDGDLWIRQEAATALATLGVK